MPGQKSFIGNKRPGFYTDKYGTLLKWHLYTNTCTFLFLKTIRNKPKINLWLYLDHEVRKYRYVCTYRYSFNLTTKITGKLFVLWHHILILCCMQQTVMNICTD